MVHHTQKAKNSTCDWFWADESQISYLDWTTFQL